MNLQDSVIIIEAPNKCEKIEKFSGAKVFATKGHFKSLPLENYINWDTYENFQVVSVKSLWITYFLRVAIKMSI